MESRCLLEPVDLLARLPPGRAPELDRVLAERDGDLVGLPEASAAMHVALTAWGVNSADISDGSVEPTSLRSMGSPMGDPAEAIDAGPSAGDRHFGVDHRGLDGGTIRDRPPFEFAVCRDRSWKSTASVVRCAISASARRSTSAWSIGRPGLSPTASPAKSLDTWRSLRTLSCFTSTSSAICRVLLSRALRFASAGRSAI
jgi:hypothetical protein